MRIPLSSPDIIESDIEAVTQVLRSLRLSLGPKLEEFEKSVATYVGASHAVAVNSGTSGLHLCIRALGIGPGDEVIVPSFTFIAAANAIRYENAIPVFVDIEPHTLNLDSAKIEAAITAKTRAILVAHTFGCPAEMSAIFEVARRHKLFVIEDACEALGAEYDGKKVGPLGDVGVFAFYPNKQITTGEGGVIVTQSTALAKRMAAMRNHGRHEGADWFEHAELGYNYRLSEMNCALGCEQINRIEAILQRREAVARRYFDRLSGNPNLVVPPMSIPGRRISWFVYVVRTAEHFSREQRDRIWRGMNDKGIGCGRYFAPIHLQKAYLHELHRKGDLAVTEAVAERTLALPFFNRISEEQIDEVCQTLAALVK